MNRAERRDARLASIRAELERRHFEAAMKAWGKTPATVAKPLALGLLATQEEQ